MFLWKSSAQVSKYHNLPDIQNKKNFLKLNIVIM